MNGPLAGGDAGRTVGDALVESRCDSACYEDAQAEPRDMLPAVQTQGSGRPAFEAAEVGASKPMMSRQYFSFLTSFLCLFQHRWCEYSK